MKHSIKGIYTGGIFGIQSNILNLLEFLESSWSFWNSVEFFLDFMVDMELLGRIFSHIWFIHSDERIQSI